MWMCSGRVPACRRCSRHSGSQRRVPVIVHGGKVEIGFEGHS